MKRSHPRYRNKPLPPRLNSFGLPRLLVCPTEADLRWRFRDLPARDINEYYDMVQYSGPETHATAQDMLMKSAMQGGRSGELFCEIGVQCFDVDGRWPLKTDLLCWWCLHQFETRPFPCPTVRLREGVIRVRGVFCGPSCAKAWAMRDGGSFCSSYTCQMIDELARQRGFLLPGKHFLYVPPAPPRECLREFSGHEGMTIEQFRGLCAKCYDVEVKYPPFVMERQVVIAECDRTKRMGISGRLVHNENPSGFMISAAEFARMKREGAEIFAGVGVKRLSDYVNKDNKPILVQNTPKGTGEKSNIQQRTRVSHKGRGVRIWVPEDDNVQQQTGKSDGRSLKSK